MKLTLLALSALLFNVIFASSVFAYSLHPSTGPTNPTPGLPCTTPTQAP